MKTGRIFAVALLAMTFAGLAGCRENKQADGGQGKGDQGKGEASHGGEPVTPSTQPAGEGVVTENPKAATAPSAMYVEIIEINHDTFANSLGEFDTPAQSTPFQFLGDRLLTNDSAGAGELFVLHTVQYDGQGRDGSTTAFYEFKSKSAGSRGQPGPPGPASPADGKAGVTGVIPLPGLEQPPRVPEGTWQYDPAGDVPPFIVATHDIRLFPAGATKAAGIEIRQAGPADGGKEGSLVITLGAIAKTLAPGEQAVLSDVSRELSVSEKPLRSADVELAPEEQPAGPDEALLPGVDHGKVTFSTKLIVKFHGRFPVTTQPAGSDAPLDVEGMP